MNTLSVKPAIYRCPLPLCLDCTHSPFGLPPCHSRGQECEDGQDDGLEAYGENDVAGGGEDDCEKKKGEASPNTMYRVPESSIRKVVSGRQAAAKRWKKVIGQVQSTFIVGGLLAQEI